MLLLFLTLSANSPTGLPIPPEPIAGSEPLAVVEQVSQDTSSPGTQDKILVTATGDLVIDGKDTSQKFEWYIVNNASDLD